MPYRPEAMGMLAQTSPFKNPDLLTKPLSDQTDDAEEDDLDDDNDSSQSEEDDNDNDNPEDDEPFEKKFEDFKRKEEEAIKAKGIEEMLNDYNDPLNYYFYLREKNKEVPDELMSLIKEMDQKSSRRSLIKDRGQASVFLKRLGTSIISAKKPTVAKKPTKKIARDSFEDDPFFEEFTDSVKRPHIGVGNGGVINVGLLRRSKRDASDEDVTMTKYKIAAEIASNKDPKKCMKVFRTCPFSSEEVMSMIIKMNKEDGLSANRKNQTTSDSITNLESTLKVLEKLNTVTNKEKSSGEDEDEALVDEAVASAKMDGPDSNEKQSTDTESDPDATDLQKASQPQQLETSTEEKQETVTPKKKGKSKPRKSIRTRRHDVVHHYPFAPIRITKQKHDLFYSGREDEFLRDSSEGQGHPRGKRFSEEYSEEDGPSEETFSPKPVLLKAKPVPGKSKSKISSEIPAKLKVQHDAEEEDDDVNSPESEEVVNVPSMTFSQAFIDTLGTPSRKKPKPKPVHKVVQVKPQSLKLSSLNLNPSPITTTTTKRPRKTTPLPRLKPTFSKESEDDEADAINKEKEIDAIVVSKYKPKGKLQ